MGQSNGRMQVLFRDSISIPRGYDIGNSPAGDSIKAILRNPDDVLACTKAIQKNLDDDPIECGDADFAQQIRYAFTQQANGQRWAA